MDTDEVNHVYQHVTEEWCGQMLERGVSYVKQLASRSHPECRPYKIVETRNGSFNLCYKVVFEQDETSWAVRFPIPGRVMQLEEKVRRIVAILEYLSEKTLIPVPRVVTWGAGDFGPFLITEWIEGVTLTSVMKEHPREEWGPVMRYDIDDHILRRIYRQMAKIYLELSKHDFDNIGALSRANPDDKDEQSLWVVRDRPLTLKANEIQAGGNVSVDDHALEPLTSATDYMKNLVKQSMLHLKKQRNSIDDAEDARVKYIFRRRMEKLVPHFASSQYNFGPFKLFCDDLRPGNVLVDPETFEINAVIDWEWTHTAPYQFLYSPPQWLILETPPTWTEYGESRYMEKLELFIQCLEHEEALTSNRPMPPKPKFWEPRQDYKPHSSSGMEKSTLWNQSRQPRFSEMMRQSVRDGSFWFIWLLRETFNFDDRVMGPNLEKVLTTMGLSDVGMPSEEEVNAVVDRKMKDLQSYNQDLRKIEEYDDEKAR